jgi:hypothetical protein
MRKIMSRFSLLDWLNERDSFREEWLLLLFLLVVAVAAYTVAESYPRNDALLPQIASVTIVLCVFALLAKSGILSIYGDTLRSTPLIQDTETESTDDEGDEGDGGDKFKMDDSGKSRIDDLSRASIIPRTALMVAYPVVGYLFGLLWATPVFVFIYMYWTGQSRMKSGVFAVTSFVVAFAFLYLLNLRIDSGLLFGGL